MQYSIMSEKNDEVVYLNNCDLVIDSIAFKTKGTFYLVWKKGKKSTQSTKFQIAADGPIHPKELLSLSLKIYHQANLALPRHTHLIVFNGAGQQIERTKLMIHQWAGEFKQSTIQLANATIKLRFKRRAIMKLQKFHRLRSEVQQTSQDEGARFLKKLSGKSGTSERDEILRLTKELEDQCFLTEKLKQERNGALIRIKNLQQELNKVQERMRKDIKKLTEYSTLRMQMRESIYKQQIQHLISAFNKNYELNYALLQSLIKEKYEYEEQIERLQLLNEQYIEEQNLHLQNLKEEMEEQKKKINGQIENSNQQLKEYKDEIVELKDELDQTKTQLQSTKETNRKLENTLKKLQEELIVQINQRNLKIIDYEDIMETDKLTIKNITEELAQKDKDLLDLNKIYGENLSENTEINKLNLALNEEKEALQAEHIILNNELIKLRTDLQEQNDQINKLRQTYDTNTNELVRQLQKRQEGYTKDVEALRGENVTLHYKFDQAKHQCQLLNLQIMDLKDVQKSKEAEIQIYKRELQSQKLMYDHLVKENNDSLEHFKNLQRDYNQKIGQYISRNTQFEIQNTQLKGDLHEITAKSTNQLQYLRETHQKQLQMNRKIHDDQLETLRNQIAEQNADFEQMKAQYDQELQTMVQHHKNQLDELQHLYKDEIENKTKEFIELLQKNSKLTEELQDLKMKVQLQRINSSQKKGKMPAKKWNAEKIDEEDEEEEELIETVEVESEEEQPIIKKKVKGKKKPIVVQISEEEQQQSDNELKGQSIVEMLKKKKNVKHRLKKGRRHNTYHQQDQQNQEQHIGQIPQEEQIKNISNSVEAKQSSIEKIQLDESHEKPKLIKKLTKKSTHNKKLRFSEQQFQELKAQNQELALKVDELQAEVVMLQKNERKSRQKYEREEKKYKVRISALEGEIQALNQQINSIQLTFGEKDSKMQQLFKQQNEVRKKQAEQRQKQIDQRTKLIQKQSKKQMQIQVEPSPKSVSSRKKQSQKEKSPREIKQSSRQAKSKKQDLQNLQRSKEKSKKSPERQEQKASQKKINERKYRERIEELQDLLADKQKKIEKLNKKNKQLANQIDQNAAQAIERKYMLESKLIQADRQPRYIPTISVDTNMKASLALLEEKFSSEKQKYQEIKLRYQSKSRELQSVQGELRRAKQRIEELQQKIKKQSIPRSMQELQSQIDDGNRKILQLSRTVNQARLERDSFEDQIRLIKKKMAENNKISQQWEARAAQSNREVDDLKRKQQSYKRQIEQSKIQEKRLKENYRKINDELVEARKNQSQFVMERKKVLDEIVRLQGVLAQRQTDIIKLNKQNEKLRTKMTEDVQGRTGKQREFRMQFEKNEIQRSKIQRKSREQQQIINTLKSKLQAAEKEAKKSLQERKQTYGQKLKKYIQEIMAVKQVVEQYQQENAHLKNQNSEFFEQNQIFKMSYEKLEIKYEQLSQHDTKLQQEINGLKQKVKGLEQGLKKKTGEEQKANNLIATIRKQLDSQRVASRKKTQKLQSYEEINERYLYEIKNLKIKLNDLQNNADDVQKVNEEFHASQRTIDSLQEELYKINEVYQQHSNKFVYTRQDVEAAIREIKEHQDKVKEEQLARVVQELDQIHTSKCQNMENQLLLLYSENEKLRVSLQRATQDSLESQTQLNELEAYKQKCKYLEKEKGMLQRRAAELNDNLKSSRQECRRLQVKFNESIRSQQGKSTENVVMSQKYDELNRKYRQLSDSYNELRVEDRRLLEKYKAASDEKDTTIQSLHSQIQTVSNKLLANQLQIRRLKQLDKFNSQESAKKIKRLQSRLEQATHTNQLSFRDMQSKYKNQIKQLKVKTTKYQEQISAKAYRIQQLNDGVLTLQGEVEEITIELTNARAQIAEDGQIYTAQINKLRNDMRQMEQVYDNNLKNLQEELSAMSKQLTALKFARQTNNSRLKLSRQSQGGDERSAKRFQEKLKFKDRRIEELKQTILVLQDKLTEKGRPQTKGQADSIKLKMQQMQKDHSALIEKKDGELSRVSEELKRIKQDAFRLRSKQEELLLIIEERDLQIQSLSGQLSMISKLYSDLQREIERRKENLNLQIKEESILKLEIQTKNRQLSAKSEQIAQMYAKYFECSNINKKKSYENAQLVQRIEELQRKNNQLLSAQRAKLQGESLVKVRLKEAEKELQLSKGQNRKLRNQLHHSLKEIDTLKSDLFQKNTAITDLLKQIQINDNKITENQQRVTKLITLNQKSNKLLNLNVEDAIDQCLELRKIIENRQEQLEALFDQHEQLKFMFERKCLDFQEQKKQNCDLVLKLQERQISYQEMQQMQDRIIQLSQQNKDLSFKEEAIKVQLESIYSQLQNEREGSPLRRKISDILDGRYA